MAKYCVAGGKNGPPEMANSGWKMQHDSGARTEDIVRLEVVVGISIKSSTVPPTFRIVLDIFSWSTLLQ